ncbi:MAG: enoyl-CoA hydratase-related protein, partial [Pseudomonadota bacterium]
MGMAKAMGAALFAEKITAAQADAWGMIWEAIPDDEFDAKWKARAEHLANGPTQAFAAAKRVIRASWGNDLEAQLASEAMEQGQCGQSRDFREGVIAFIEKRKPSFEGR